MLTANKIFHVTVVLVIYFCDQFFVAAEIHHNRLHCSVCQQSIWYSAMTTTPAPNSHISIQVVHILTEVSYLLSFTHNLIESLTSKAEFLCYLRCGS